MFNLVFSSDACDGISKGINCPWQSNPLDVKTIQGSYVNSLTENNIAIMGKNTFHSLDTLSNKIYIILGKSDITIPSKSVKLTNVVDFNTINDLIFPLVFKVESINKLIDFVSTNLLKSLNKYIIGGIDLIHTFYNMNLFKEIHQFTLHSNYKCDKQTIIKTEHQSIVESTLISGHNRSVILYSHYKRKNNEEVAYVKLVKSIEQYQPQILFSPQSLLFDLEKSFPLLSTNYIKPLKSIFFSLMWMIKGNTNISWLSDYNATCLSDSVNDSTKDAGPNHGFQMRYLQADYKDCNTDYSGQGVDQLNNLIKSLVKYTGTTYTKDFEIILQNPYTIYHFHRTDDAKLSLKVILKECDIYLDSYMITFSALFCVMIAKVCNLTPGVMTWSPTKVTLSDIYTQHVQLLLDKTRIPKTFPILFVDTPKDNLIDNFVFEDIKLYFYECYPPIIPQKTIISSIIELTMGSN